MMLRRFLSYNSSLQKDLVIHCDGHKYTKRRDGGKELASFEIIDNELYLYTKRNERGFGYYTVTLIYQFQPNLQSTKKRKTEVFDYISDDLCLARLRARFKLQQKKEILKNKHIYSYDVDLRVYKDKKNYESIYFKRNDIDLQ